MGYAQALCQGHGLGIDVHTHAKLAVGDDIVVEPSALHAFVGNQGTMVGKAQVQHSPACDQTAECGVAAVGLKLQGQARSPVSLELPIGQHIQQVRDGFLKRRHKKYNRRLKILSRGRV